MFMNLVKIVFLLICCEQAYASSLKSSSWTEVTDVDTLEYLLKKAERISSLPSITMQQLPAIYLLNRDNLDKTVCPNDPHNCRNLAAVFDDISYRILIVDELEISSNFIPYNYSFVIHEIVHALQYRHYGAEIFNGCSAIYNTELLAYSTQDKYLKEEGAFQRLGPQFRRGFYCDEKEAIEEYKKSKNLWDHRIANGWK